MLCPFSRPCAIVGRQLILRGLSTIRFADVLRGHPDLDELIVYERDGWGIDPWGIGRTARLVPEAATRPL